MRIGAAHRSWAVMLVTVVLAVACSMPSSTRSVGPRGASAATHPSNTHPSKAPRTTTTTTTVPPTTTTEQPGWTPASAVAGAIAVDSRSVTGPGGGAVTLFRFRADHVRYALHAGSTDPPGAAAIAGPDSGGAIGPHEGPLLLAAFNGGFKTNAGVGGFELNSQVFVPLQVGLASLVIDTDGSAHIGVWGQDVPRPGEQVLSVRQNLNALVVGGRPSSAVDAVGAWGSTLGGGAAVARSALGEDAAGNLIYAGSMGAVPADLATALVGAGAQAGMELDINPEWVQLAVAAAPGAPLAAGIPGQNRPADQYQAGWTRDFITVTATS
jgi:hypothetical protein